MINPSTLPSDSNVRKSYPLYEGCLRYFPAALAGVAFHSVMGNVKHNIKGPLRHDRSKSTDHADCILRHLVDLGDLLAASERRTVGTQLDDEHYANHILEEADAIAWRALALSQELHERYSGAPVAPGAYYPEEQDDKSVRR